jgi:DNA-directed RNA polymerase specialized sigma24 family protein
MSNEKRKTAINVEIRMKLEIDMAAKNGRIMPEVIMDCSSCDHYNRGRGQKACLKCKKYKEIQLKSVKRESIRTEHLPQEIMDNIADPKTRTLMATLTTLPTQYAVPILMRAVLNMSLQEIAAYHGVTRGAIQQKIFKGVELIKESLLSE